MQNSGPPGGYPPGAYPGQPQQQQWPQPHAVPPGQPQQWPQQSAQPVPGQPMVWKLHSGARTALNIAGGLLVLLIMTIPIAIWIFVRVAGAKIEIKGDEIIFKNLMGKRWKLSSLRRIGVLAVPVYARGIGGMLARKKVGGDRAIHLCAIDDRGKKSSFIISMYERHPEIIQAVAGITRLPVEEVQSGAFGPKWPGA